MSETPAEEPGEPSEPDETEAAEAELADNPLVTPLPGFGMYNPIFGGGDQIGALEGTSYSRAVLPEDLGEVLLRVEGRRQDAGSLMSVVVGGVMIAALPCLFFPRSPLRDLVDQLPWTTSEGLVCGALGWGAVALVLLARWGLRPIFDAGVAVFTEQGVARTHNQAAAFVPWEKVEGYRDGDPDYVLLQHEDGELSVPTVEQAVREAVLELLDGRCVVRLD